MHPLLADGTLSGEVRNSLSTLFFDSNFSEWVSPFNKFILFLLKLSSQDPNKNEEDLSHKHLTQKSHKIYVYVLFESKKNKLLSLFESVSVIGEKQIIAFSSNHFQVAVKFPIQFSLSI